MVQPGISDGSGEVHHAPGSDSTSDGGQQSYNPDAEEHVDTETGGFTHDTGVDAGGGGGGLQTYSTDVEEHVDTETGGFTHDTGVDVPRASAEVREQVASQVEGVGPGDIQYVDEVTGQFRLTESAVADRVDFEREPRRLFAGTERIPLGVDEPTGEDITFRDGEPAFTSGFRDELLDAQIEEEERRLRAQTPTLEPGEQVLQRTDDGVEFTDDALADVVRSQAAEDDPLRDADEFVANVGMEDGERSVDVRGRAEPFFEEQREAVGEATGLGLPDVVEDPLTTDSGESRIRRGLQRGSEWFSDASESHEDVREGIGPRPGEAAEEATGIDSAVFGIGEDISRAAFQGANLPEMVLGTAAVAEQAADLGQAELETTADIIGSGESTEIVDAVSADVGAEPAPLSDGFRFDVPEESAAAEEREATVEAATQAGEQTIEVARERPGLLIGALGAGAAFSAGSGLALGRGLQGTVGRARTFGGTEIDAADIVNPSTRRVFDEDAAGDRFPGFEDPELARRDPASAVAQQADEYTPAALDEAIPGDDPVLFKAMDVEPEGPGRGRVAQGFRTQEGSYESPGAFVGPELSPNFLRVGGNREFSLRPGLPDTGGRPTAVAVRTDVESPDAETLTGFNRELLDREGETAARTKPASEVNVDEAEAVIPGEAEFSDVGGSPMRNTLRQFGIGSDFYTEIGGQRVPIRGVTPAESQPGLFGRFLGDDRGQVGAGGAGDQAAFRGSLDELGRAGSPTVDRPAPIAGAAPGSPSASDAVGDVDVDAYSGASVGAESRVGAGSAGVDVEPAASEPSATSERADYDVDASTSAFAGGETSRGGSARDVSRVAASPGVSSPFGSGTPSSPFSPAAPASEGVPAPSGFEPTPSAPTPSPFGPTPGGYSPSPPGPSTTRPPATPPLPGFDEDPGAPEPERREFEPATPEFRNPIASGVDDLLDAFNDASWW